MSDKLSDDFWKNVSLVPGVSCWLWHGTTGAYGEPRYMRPADSSRRKHCAVRFAYEALVGPIPPGTHPVGASCAQRGCVNPGHYVLSNKVNRVHHIRERARAMGLAR